MKFLFYIRWLVNKVFSLKFFNNKSNLKIIKHLYSFITTKSGVKNVKNYIVEIDKKIMPIICEYNGYIGCGNCLFLARHQNDFGNNDIDYCIQDPSDSQIEDLINKCEHVGFTLSCKLYHNNEIIELKFKYKKTYLDIFILRSIDNEYVKSKTILLNDKIPKIKTINKHMALTQCCIVEQKWSKTHNVIDAVMFNHNFKIPENYNEYLTLQYGEDWRIPNPNFDFLTMPKNNLPILHNGEGIIIYE